MGKNKGKNDALGVNTNAARRGKILFFFGGGAGLFFGLNLTSPK
jgi:hypothetical protein